MSTYSAKLMTKLYREDDGRPNFPVNIMLSLEFIKHFKDYSDEELIEQFYFNYQIIYALVLTGKFKRKRGVSYPAFPAEPR